MLTHAAARCHPPSPALACRRPPAPIILLTVTLKRHCEVNKEKYLIEIKSFEIGRFKDASGDPV